MALLLRVSDILTVTSNHFLEEPRVGKAASSAKFSPSANSTEKAVAVNSLPKIAARSRALSALRGYELHASSSGINDRLDGHSIDFILLSQQISPLLRYILGGVPSVAS